MSWPVSWLLCPQELRGASESEGRHRASLADVLGTLPCEQRGSPSPSSVRIPEGLCLVMKRAVFPECLFPSWHPLFQMALRQQCLQREKRSSADPSPLLAASPAHLLPLPRALSH